MALLLAATVLLAGGAGLGSMVASEGGLAPGQSRQEGDRGRDASSGMTGSAPEGPSGERPRDEDASGPSPEAVGAASGGSWLAPGLADSVGRALGQGEVRGRTSPQALADEAAEVLATYRDEGSCVLLRSGYLDLFGRVWSCTVLGGSWVEVQVLTERGEGVGTDVVVVHMDARAWGEGYPGAPEEVEGT